MTINEYIELHSTPENDLLKQITHDTNVYQLAPHMLSGHIQGRLLAMLSKMLQPTIILELGTFTGYSALCLAEGLREEGVLHTIEHNDELEDTIKHNLSLSPLSERIILHIGDAKKLLNDFLTTNDTKPQHEYLDLVFIDADKREYADYYELVFPLVKQGGYIIADNTLWDGHIIETQYDNDKQTLGLRRFNDLVAKDHRVEKVILPIRDGLTIIRKI